MAWIHLLVAGLLEVLWATTMKLSDGFSKLNYSLLTVIGMIASFFFLAKAIKLLPMSLAYPIWTGIGALGSIIVGVLLFKDSLSLKTWFFVCLLLIGLVGIKMTSNH